MPILCPNTLPLEQLTDLATRLRQVAAVLDGIVSSVAHGSRIAGAEMASLIALTSLGGNATAGNCPSPPIADRTTFSARWQGKSCHLGNTIIFKLLERLSRRPNQFVHFEVLLQDVWEGRRSPEAVRSAVKVLRQKLTSAGMDDLATAIDGSTAHHYRLSLNGQF
jgi:hypothetical protein